MPLFGEDVKVKALGSAPLFDGLSSKQLQELAKVADELQVEAGRVLTRQGHTGHEFFVLMEGEVEIERDGTSLGTRGAGDFIGEIAILEDVPRTATVTAKTPLTFFVLTAQSFRSVVDRHPDVENKVLRALARRVLSLSDDPSLS